MVTSTPSNLTFEKVQQIRRNVMANVSIHESGLTTLSDFFFDHNYDGIDAQRILQQHGIFNSSGEPTRRWNRDKFFMRLLVTASKMGKLPVLYRYEYHLTKRGVHLLDRILKDVHCKPYPYKKRR